MIVRVISVQVKLDCIDLFEEETQQNHVGSIQEPGVLRFDVLRDPTTAGNYLLYEVYRDQAAVEAHKETAHYARWRDAVADCMAAPRQSTAYEVVAPADPAAW